MVYFLQGGALLDLERPAEALSAYSQCMAAVSPGDALHDGALVRRATCLAELRRWEDILHLRPASPPTRWHPELLVIQGQAEIATGNRKSAVDLLTQVFDSPDSAAIPAFDPVRLRARALVLLAELFKHTCPRAAIEMLRLAQKSVSSGHKPSLAEVLSIHFS